MSLLGLLLADAGHGQAFWWEPCTVFVLVLSLSYLCLCFIFVLSLSYLCLCLFFVFVMSCQYKTWTCRNFLSLPSFACSLITLYLTWWFLFDPNDKLILLLRSVFKPPNFWSRFRATQFLCIFKKAI